MAVIIEIEGRIDLSPFVMHLTKESGGITARQQLISILKSAKVEARSYHSLFNEELEKMPANVQSKFHVACFSEAPLIFVKYITIPLRTTSIPLEPYGVFFGRKEMIEFKGNPAIYVTKTFTNYEWIRFRAWQESGTQNPVGTLPLVNLFSDGYDFTWEREWRTVGNMQFYGIGGARGIILPAEGDDDLAKLFAKHTTPVIRSGMSQEQIDLEMQLPGAADKAQFYSDMDAF